MRKSVYIIALLFSLTSGFALADLSGLLKKVEETVSDIEDTLEDAEDALSPSESSADEVKETLDGNQPNNDALQKKPQPNQSTDSSQKAAETSESGEKGVAIRGKLYADGPPKVGLIGQRFRAGEYGTDPRYYALFIGLIDRRDTTLNCNTYVLDRFSESGNRSEFKSDIDRLDAMRGKEVVLENVRKSTAGKTCVFSGYRLNNDVSSFAYENRDRNLVDMLPAGNRIVDKVSIRGIRLCGDLTEASEILEARGYKNAVLFAKSTGRISNLERRQGIDNYLFTINNDPYNKSSRMYSISFQSSFKDGPNVFDQEKARFEKDTSIKLSCNQSKVGTNDIRNICQYPSGEADFSSAGFMYRITHAINSNSMYVDASAWGYSGCGAPVKTAGPQSVSAAVQSSATAAASPAQAHTAKQRRFSVTLRNDVVYINGFTLGMPEQQINDELRKLNYETEDFSSRPTVLSDGQSSLRAQMHSKKLASVYIQERPISNNSKDEIIDSLKASFGDKINCQEHRSRRGNLISCTYPKGAPGGHYALTVNFMPMPGGYSLNIVLK
jgi:hypothetical protein